MTEDIGSPIGRKQFLSLAAAQPVLSAIVEITMVNHFVAGRAFRLATRRSTALGNLRYTNEIDGEQDRMQ